MDILITPIINQYVDTTLLGKQRFVTDLIAILIDTGNSQKIYFNSDCNLRKALKEQSICAKMMDIFSSTDIDFIKKEFNLIAFRFNQLGDIVKDIIHSSVDAGDIYVTYQKEVSIITSLVGETVYSIEQKEKEACNFSLLRRTEARLNRTVWPTNIGEFTKEMRNLLTYIRIGS